MKSLYIDPARETGSQSEVPGYRYEGGRFCVDGYQRYCLAPDGISLGKPVHRRKYAVVRPYLLGSGLEKCSIMDLGCSAGAMGFQAWFDGFHDIVFVDHDPEYLDLVSRGLRHIGAHGPIVRQSKAHDVDAVADVLFAFAIIHWLYSCTEDFGSLRRIVDQLASYCRKAMFVEWVDPTCKDVQSFGHLRRNPEYHEEAYNRENFVRALQHNFAHVTRIGAVQKSRELWLASHQPVRPSRAIMVRERLGYWSEALARRLASRRARIRVSAQR